MSEPVLIQGGMGAAVSNWRLARTVSSQGQLGVVSGTAIDCVLVRRLQDGDPDGHMRRALAQFPIPTIADAIIQTYYIPNGKQADEPYKLLPMPKQNPTLLMLSLTVAANFVEVYLAKEGHNGLVGINYLEKIQMPTLPSIYGAMLANVDYILMGAGIPKTIPHILDELSNHKAVNLKLNVEGSTKEFKMHFDPKTINPNIQNPLKRPKFLAIVASHVLASTLANKSTGHVDGFVIENHTAGGHNAPPRGSLKLDNTGNPIYGDRDNVNLDEIKKLKRPFWLAGSYCTPQKLQEALSLGACGIQVGTVFAFCRESGLAQNIKTKVIQKAKAGLVEVHTDSVASPTNFPFKIVQIDESLSQEAIYQNRPRICDLGYLRTAYQKDDGTLGLRCPGEPIDTYLQKNGNIEDTVGRKCLCNALMADIGLPQVQKDSYVEKILITSGDNIQQIASFVKDDETSYSAIDVINYLMLQFTDSHPTS